MNFRKIAVAFAIALVISAVCTISLGRRLSASAAQRKVSRRYVAPARALNPNEILKAESLTLIDWPGDVEVPGAFTKISDLVGRTVLFPVDMGQPLTEKLVSVPGSGTGLASRIPDGMRAIALRTDEVIGVAGFLLPGSRLDVLATYHLDKSPEPVTATVLQNAEVLAIGHQMEPDPDGKPAPVTVVTLLLSPEDAEKAVLASSQGSLHFVMRSGSDAQVNKDQPVLLSALTPGLSAASPSSPSPVTRSRSHARPPAPKPAPQVYTVEMILGDKQITNKFQVGEQ